MVKPYRLLFCSFVLATNLLGGHSASAATYYVSTTGGDTQSCAAAQSPSTPKRTLNSAVACLSPGDTLLVRQGVYAESLLGRVPSGTSWSSKVLVAAYPGETVTMRPTSGAQVLHFRDNQQYIEIDGVNLDASNVSSGAVKIEAIVTSTLNWNPHHIRVKNATLTGVGPGQSGHASLVLIIAMRSDSIGSNEFINLTLRRSSHNLTTYRTNGFYIQGPNNLIELCKMDNLNGFGLQTYNGNVPRTEPNNNTVRYNIIRDMPVTTERTQGVLIGQGSGNKVYGNLVYNLRGTEGGSAGIYAFGGTKTEIYNNTIHNVATEGLIVESNVSSTTVRNNVSQGNGADYRNNGIGTLFSDNIIGTDPHFVDVGRGDFRLKSTSPAIDAGATITIVTTDLDGKLRPRGAAFDIGAYEYGGVLPSPPSNVHIMR